MKITKRLCLMFVTCLMFAGTAIFCAACGSSAHVHEYSDVWSADGTNHWHECSCGDKKDTAEHTWDNGTADAETGDTTYACTICGEGKIIIPSLETYFAEFDLVKDGKANFYVDLVISNNLNVITTAADNVMSMYLTDGLREEKVWYEINGEKTISYMKNFFGHVQKSYNSAAHMESLVESIAVYIDPADYGSPKTTNATEHVYVCKHDMGSNGTATATLTITAEQLTMSVESDDNLFESYGMTMTLGGKTLKLPSVYKDATEIKLEENKYRAAYIYFEGIYLTLNDFIYDIDMSDIEMSECEMKAEAAEKITKIVEELIQEGEDIPAAAEVIANIEEVFMDICVWDYEIAAGIITVTNPTDGTAVASGTYDYSAAELITEHTLAVPFTIFDFADTYTWDNQSGYIHMSGEFGYIHSILFGSLPDSE